MIIFPETKSPSSPLVLKPRRSVVDLVPRVDLARAGLSQLLTDQRSLLTVDDFLSEFLIGRRSLSIDHGPMDMEFVSGPYSVKLANEWITSDELFDSCMSELGMIFPMGIIIVCPSYLVESDVDEELLFNIPFKNRPHMTFDDVNANPEQEFELHPDTTGSLEYPVKVVKFSSVHHLTLHFPRNFGNETTKIYYIGLRGEYSKAHRHGVTICSYEAVPNMEDHKTNAFDSVSHPVHIQITVVGFIYNHN
uniref:PITH domain-containing protein n=1 Tax=Timema poppense TaxID=170557 RepID=A0A7R9H3R4_TIMPO|nr:unnamed protein product [Timema poppensis]